MTNEPTRRTDPSILVIDDFATMRRLIRQSLKNSCFENITEAESGLKALSLIKENTYDIILSDWMMPDVWGIELVRTVRLDPRHHSVPFIMITSEGHKDSVVEAAESGVTSYILKPFTPKFLEEKLTEVFREHLGISVSAAHAKLISA
jgi:two-component system chemotaxis response regulator CheY